MKPKISIIVPVYNVENYIDDCIKSIINQEFKNFELIIINDGSSDNSGDICDRYALIDNRIRVIHKKNEGASKARNLGIKISKGDYIAFVDSDDTINEKMYDIMYNLAISSKCEVVVCGYKEINYKLGIENKFINPLYGRKKLQGEDIKKRLQELLCENKILGYPSLCNKLYKKDYITKNKLEINENIKIAEDLCFNVIIMLGINEVVAINEPLYEYRRVNENSIMNSSNNLYLKFEAREVMLNIFKELEISKSVYKKCLGYESSTTVTSYIGLIKEVFLSNKKLNEKILMFNRLLNEKYFLNAINNVDYKYLTFKTSSMTRLIKIYLAIIGKKV